jgi:hypothetical protein
MYGPTPLGAARAAHTKKGEMEAMPREQSLSTQSDPVTRRPQLYPKGACFHAVLVAGGCASILKPTGAAVAGGSWHHGFHEKHEQILADDFGAGVRFSFCFVPGRSGAAAACGFQVEPLPAGTHRRWQVLVRGWLQFHVRPELDRCFSPGARITSTSTININSNSPSVFVSTLIHQG